MPCEFIRFTENPKLFIQQQFWDKLRFRYVGKHKMSIVFQIALISLVLFSFVLVVGVPVAYATPQNWVESKKLLWVGSGIWAALVVLVGILNFFVVQLTALIIHQRIPQTVNEQKSSGKESKRKNKVFSISSPLFVGWVKGQRNPKHLLGFLMSTQSTNQGCFNFVKVLFSQRLFPDCAFLLFYFDCRKVYW